jgi:MoaD family protein
LEQKHHTGARMKVIVKYFAFFKELTGTVQETIEIENGKTTKELLGIIMKKYGLENIQNLVLSVNHEYVKTEVRLKENDEVAIMVPTSGG